MFLDAFWHTWPALEKSRVLFRFGCHFGGHWRASGRIFVLNVFLEAFLRVTFFTDGSKRPPGCPQTPFAPHLRSDFFLELYLLLPLHFHFSLQRQRKTLPADGMSSLPRGAAMTRRRRLQYIYIYSPHPFRGAGRAGHFLQNLQNLKLRGAPPPAAGPCPKCSKINAFSDLEKKTKKRRIEITKVATMEGLQGPWELPFEQFD
jgi:hypothetical protein